MPTLELHNISKTFSDDRRQRITAAKNLTFSIADELLVVVGPSGCGKTTMLRLIAGLEKPDDGTISLDGKLLNPVAAKDRDIAMVFQTPALLPHLTAFENMAFGLKLRKVQSDEVKRRVQVAAETLKLSEKLNRKPHELSGGEAQRVALARALVREPKTFLLDEPLSSLDAPARKQLRREIVCLQQRLRVPMIYVTHDQREALSLGQRIAVLRQGELQQIGTPDEIQKNPANEFVAEFFEDSM